MGVGVMRWEWGVEGGCGWDKMVEGERKRE